MPYQVTTSIGSSASTLTRTVLFVLSMDYCSFSQWEANLTTNLNLQWPFSSTCDNAYNSIQTNINNGSHRIEDNLSCNNSPVSNNSNYDQCNMDSGVRSIFIPSTDSANFGQWQLQAKRTINALFSTHEGKEIANRANVDEFSLIHLCNTRTT